MLKALEDRVIIQVDKEEEQVSSSGLVIAGGHKEAKNIGTVVAVGPGRTLSNGVQLDPEVAVGDRVAFNLMATQKIEFDGEEYLAIFVRDVLAIL